MTIPQPADVLRRLLQRKHAHMLEGAARALALRILGESVVLIVERAKYSIPSTFAGADIEYYCGLSSIIKLYRYGRPLGSLCLMPRGRYPAWDGALSRILLLRHNEVMVLRTANYVPPEFGTAQLNHPMTREAFLTIFGQQHAEVWDAFCRD